MSLSHPFRIESLPHPRSRPRPRENLLRRRSRRLSHPLFCDSISIAGLPPSPCRLLEFDFRIFFLHFFFFLQYITIIEGWCLKGPPENLTAMLLPKGGITWKSAKAQIPATRAMLVLLTRTRFLLLIAITTVALLLWRGIRTSASDLQRYVCTICPIPPSLPLFRPLSFSLRLT